MTGVSRPAPPGDGERRKLQEAILTALEDLETVATDRDRLAERVRVLEARVQTAGTSATPPVPAEADEEVLVDSAARVRTLADLALRIHASPGRTTQTPLEAGVGSPESFSAVIDMLATDLEMPPVEIRRRMIEDLKKRITLERAVLAHLLLLEGADASRKGQA